MHTIAPDDIVQTFAEAGRNARPPLLVLDPLQRFLDDRDLGAAPIMATPVGEGHSNVTILVSRDGWEGLVRRLPRPPLPAPNERHAVVPDAGAVEFAVSMKGNYRRAVAGLTDDPYLHAFGESVIELAERAHVTALGDRVATR